MTVNTRSSENIIVQRLEQLAELYRQDQASELMERTLSKLFKKDTVERILELRKNHPNKKAIDSFIKEYDVRNSSGKYTTRNGMFLHLLSWLRLAKVINDLPKN